MNRLYRYLRSIYTNPLLMELPTKMDFGPEDPKLVKKRQAALKWMKDNSVGPPDVERLEVPANGS